jgi:hypothetical protein
MKKIALFMVFISIYSSLSAQTQQYRLVEGEFGVSLPFGMPKVYEEQSIDIYPGLYGEIRFNIPNRHLSIGTQLYITSWDIIALGMTQNHHTSAFTTVFDYNFNEIKGFLLPFIGSGIGLASLDETAILYISPRIGVEVWNRVRFSFGYNLTDSSYSSFVCKLGFVFGGGKRK